MIHLGVHHEGRLIRSYCLAAGQYSIGSVGCDVVLQFPTVSKNHGLLRVTHHGVRYLDQTSRNGTYWASDGSAVTPSMEHDWPQSERLEIGPFELAWQREGDKTAGIESVGRFYALYSRFLAEDPAHADERLSEATSSLPEDERQRLHEEIHHEFHGDGPLRAYLGNPACREILVNRFDEIYIDVGQGLILSGARFASSQSYEAWAARTANQAGRRIDLQHPICEATLPNGARFHAVMSPLSARGVSVAIRRFGSAPTSEADALASGWVEASALAVLKKAIADRRNIVISGGTSSGKTSLLNFLCHYLPAAERIITVEDTLELAPPVTNLVQLQARTANADGVGNVTLRELVQCALRMRPDRIIVGECRGAEVVEMLQALNTGHPGSLTTVHANSTGEALERLELLTLLGASNLSMDCVRRWIESSVDLVVQVERDSDGHRRVVEISGRAPQGRVAFYRHSKVRSKADGNPG